MIALELTWHAAPELNVALRTPFVKPLALSADRLPSPIVFGTMPSISKPGSNATQHKRFLFNSFELAIALHSAAVMALTKNPGRYYDCPVQIVAGDDRVLVAEAKSGNAAAFGALYERQKSKMYRVVFRILRNHHDAEDAVQRSFLRAFTNLVRFREDSSFSTWMTRIAINEALMFLRQRRPNQPLSENDDDGTDAHRAVNLSDEQRTPEQLLNEKEMCGAVTRAIATLRPRLRMVVLLREMHGLTTSETARRLGLTLSAVKARTHQAKRHLRLHFECKCNRAGAGLQDRRCSHGC